ncbi:Bromodomain and WD repeat-containing protein 3 [Mactra antiquata]
MPGVGKGKGRQSSIELELYFLIERFLSTGPCKSAANVLRRELDENGLLPKRIDWKGQEHDRSYESLLELNRHIGGDHLLKICQRLGPLLDEKLCPNIKGVQSLLGAGTQSLLRTQQDMRQTEWPGGAHMVLQHGRSRFPPVNLITPNWLHVKRGQEISGQTYFGHMMPLSRYTRLQQRSRKLGHLSSVYCALFDRTGKYIFTGADDCLVKIWWLADSRLKATLRGHAGEITDMSINYENTLLASGSCDKTVRVWCLKSRAPAAVLLGHTGMITSLQFSPMAKGHRRYLASTGGDACVCFWEWNARDNSFNSRPAKYVEKSRAGAQVICSSFSPGGMFLAAGSTDNVIRMYQFMNGYPEKIGELEKHTDRVDSICYANNDNRFVSGSKDGTACIWKFERNQWRNIVLDMSQKLPNSDGNDESDDDDTKNTTRNYDSDVDSDVEEKRSQKLRVTMVSWSTDDSRVVTAISDCSIKVWCSFTGKLLRKMKYHKEEVFVLEPSPIDTRIMMSAGHDGNIIIWDIIQGKLIKRFFNHIEGQGHGAVFDCKFSPDSTSIAATDSHGQMMIFGYNSDPKPSQIPDQLFFHTDYRPLVRDSNLYCLDEQTQQAPHLMPPPFLVDIDGNPYPPEMQRLVPGREKCRNDQLIPELAVNEEGEQEVMGDRQPDTVEEIHPEPVEPEPGPSSSDQGGTSGEVQPTVRASIDQMIEQLAREQDQRMAALGEGPLGSPPPPSSRSPRAGPSRMNSVQGVSGSHMVGMRRVGEMEGVRQSLGNILQVSTSKDLMALSRCVVVKGLEPQELAKSEACRIAHAELEVKQYNQEKRKKNPVARRDSSDEISDQGIQTRKKKSGRGITRRRAGDSDDVATNRLTRRALYDTDEEIEDELTSDLLEEAEQYMDVDDSSDYSDWCVDTSSNLQPPKRKSARVRKRKRYTTTEESDEEESTPTPRGSREASPGSRENSQTRGKGPAKKDKQPVKKVKRKVVKKKQTPHEKAMLPGKTPEQIQELLRIWRPPDWLTDVVPRKQPYFPQMGDEVIYFRQGHEFYVKEVVRRKVYPLDPNKNQAWHKYPSLKEQELVRIVGIRYEMLKCGVRLCCLKLNYINPQTLKNSGGSFSIKYHDMPDVVDFLVLKQNYDIAMSRNWKPGDRFRSVIDDSWWIGEIEAQIPYQKEYPDSMFQCFKVRWDNSEKENLSPWDMEPFSDSWLKKPRELNGSIKISAEERKSFMYKPKPGEWPAGDIEEECDRIVHGWEKVMEHSIAEPFLTPVDLNVFPSYAMSIEYPMDLNTIKRRLENRFYRRVTALQFDLRYIESNAKTFNEPKSQIVKSVQILCDSLLHFISNPECEDACLMINKMVHGRKIQWCSDDSGEETEDYDTPDTNKKQDEPMPGTSKQSKKNGLSVHSLNPDGWKCECQHLLDTIIQCQDSEPFRQPVDIDAYPDYYNIIENPMDLSVVCSKLEHGQYNTPVEFSKDMKLIFTNSKTFNTNKRAKIYSMTLRLSAMFDSRIKQILSTWRKVIRHGKHRSNHKRPRYEEAALSSTGRLNSRTVRPGTSGLSNGKLHRSTDDDDTDLDVVTSPKKKPEVRSRPIRTRTVQVTHGYDDFDIEENNDNIKPDYSDDEYQPKQSPKKKGIGKKSSSVTTSGSTNDSSASYSTRARTGTIKMRKYTNDGFISDDNATQSVISKKQSNKNNGPHTKYNGKKGETLNISAANDDSDSDTDIESPVHYKRNVKIERLTSNDDDEEEDNVDDDDGTEETDSETEESDTPVKPVKRQKNKRNSRKSYKRTKRKVGRPPTKRRRIKHNTDSESKSEEDESESSVSENSSSETDDLVESGEGHSNIRRGSTTQGSSKYIDSESDSGQTGRRGRLDKSKYASGHSGSRQGRRTRNQGKSTIKYTEDSANSDSDDNSAVTVSMRGRVRRQTARARHMFT